MEKLRLFVEGDFENKNFSTYIVGYDIPKYGVHGYGNSAREAIADTFIVWDEMREIAKENRDYFPDFEPSFEYVFNIGAFFNYYNYLNISRVAKRIGINASLMRRYATGTAKPSNARLTKINEGLQNIAKELQGSSVGTFI